MSMQLDQKLIRQSFDGLDMATAKRQ